MKSATYRFYLLLVLSTLMGCALGHASSSPSTTAAAPASASPAASARHVVAFAGSP
jgi:hypothetical protein